MHESRQPPMALPCGEVDLPLPKSFKGRDPVLEERSKAALPPRMRTIESTVWLGGCRALFQPVPLHHKA
jgi:hypothetical protein